MKNKTLISAMLLLSATMAFAQTTYNLGANVQGIKEGETLTISGTGNMYNYSSTSSSRFGNITEVIIEEGVTSIGNYVFQNCSSLTTVTIPNSVTSIGEVAFHRCTSLTKVTIPNSVTSIGNYAFDNCSSLISVTIPNSVTSIGVGAFTYCTSLTTVTIGNSVTSIGDGAFLVCSGLTTVTIGNSVTSIGNSAFEGCPGLNTVTIPNSVTSIGENAFYFVENINYSGSAAGKPWGALTVNGIIDGDLVYSDNTKTKLTAYIGKGGNVVIPNSVTSIGGYAFYYCSGLTTVTIPNSVTSIGNSAFRGCSSLPSITIPNSVTSIGSSAFYGCSGLTTVTIGNSVTSIGNSAFEGCPGLNTVTIPNSVTSIGYNAFSGCSGLTKAEFASIESLCGITYGSSTANPLYYAKHLYVTIYENEVTDLIIPTSVTSIGRVAFVGCSSLTSVTIPNSVKTIDNLAFGGCSNLTSVTIGNSVTRIGNNAFDGCGGLTSIVYDGTRAPTIGTDAFRNVNSSVKVCVPENYSSGKFGGFGVIKGHNKVKDQAVLPTCTETGLTEGVHCSNCGRVFVAQEDIPATGHNYGAPTYAWSDDNTTCTATKVCANNSEHVVIETSNATSAITVAATCEAVGTRTFAAEFVGESFATQQKTEEIPATGHTAAEAVAKNYAAPTCTAAGAVDSVVYCSVCQNELNRKTVEIPATGHSYSTAVTAPTCTEVGFTTHNCTVCDYTYNSDTIATTGHKADSIVFKNVVAATCTAAGSKDSVVYCSVCQNELLRETKEIPVKGHIEVVDAAVAATCIAAGKTEGKHCSVCNAVLVAQEEIPALGHEFKTYTFDNNATTEADGTETATCERGCGATDTRTAAGTKIATTPEKGTAVSDAAANAISIYTQNNVIVVENAREEISVYDAMGRLVCRDVARNVSTDAELGVRTEIRFATPGIYIVKVGGTAKRVMVND